MVLDIFLYLFWIYMLEKAGSMEASNFNKRTLYASNILLFFLLIIMMRLIQVQILKEEIFASRVMGQIKKTDILSGNRGTIYDSTGKG